MMFSRPAARSCALAAFLALTSTGTQAQDQGLLDAIGQRIGAVERQVSAGLGLARPEALVQPVQFGGGGNAAAASAAQLGARLDSVEGQMRVLTGQIEQLMFQVRQMDERTKRAAEDTDYRLREMAAGRGAAPAPAGPAGAASAPARPRADAPQPAAPAAPTIAAPAPLPQPPQPGPGLATPPQTLGQVSGRPMDLAAVPRGTLSESGPTGAAPAGPGVASVMAPSATPKDEYDLAYGFILRSDYELAEEGFRNFLARYPTDGQAGNATFYLGESYFQRAKYREAADSYLKVYTQHASSPKAAESLIKLGASLRALKENEAACAALGEFGKRFPKAPSGLRSQVQAEQQKAGCT